MAKSDPQFNPTSFEKEQKGRMVLLYATVDGVRTHVASFFHEEKCDYVLKAITNTFDVKVKKPKSADAPKKTTAKTTTKTAVKKKVKK